MAENLSARTVRRSNTFLHISDSGNVSSDLVEAMDRIFPKSPSKFLQNPFPDNHGSVLSKQSAKNISSSPSILSLSSGISCSVSKAHITTDTTTTATAIFTGLSTSISGSKSPIMSSVPAYSSGVASLPAAALGDDISDEGTKNGNLTGSKKQLTKSRGSKVDLEICNQLVTDAPRSGVLDKIIIDSLRSEFEGGSVGKEKKRKKKRKKEHQRKEDNDCNGVEEDLKSSLKVSQSDCAETGLSDENALLEESNISKRVGVSDTNGYDAIPSITPLHSQSNGESSMPDEDLSLYPQTFTVKQKLPKFRRHSVYLSKDSKYLKKKMLSCFVVLKRVDELLFNSRSEKLGLDMSLSERIECLIKMCGKNAIQCHKSSEKKQGKPHNRNKYDDIHVENNSEDEFVNNSGRSLRRRNRNVCYVEPSEDDLLEDFSFSKKKKSQSSLKSSDECEEKESNKDSDTSPQISAILPTGQKKQSEEPTVIKTSGHGKQSKQKVSNKEKRSEEKCAKSQTNKTSSDSAAVSEQGPSKINERKTSQDNVMNSNSAAYSKQTFTSKTSFTDKDGRSLVYVFPKGSIVKGPGKDGSNSVDSSKSKDSSSHVKKKKIGPASKTRPVTTAPVTTLSLPRSLLSPSGNLVSPSSLANLQFPGLVQPAVSGSTTSPQFYMVKIDGKDFLVPMIGGPSQLRAGTPTRVALPPQSSGSSCRFIQVPGLPAYSRAVLARTPTPSQPSVTQLSTILLPGNAITSSNQMTTPSLSTNTILSSLPSLIANSKTATTSIPSTVLPHLSQTMGISSSNPSSLVTTAINLPRGSAALVSLVRPSSMPVINLASTSQNFVMASASGTNTSSTVMPLAAPPSTTVLRSTRPRMATTSIASASQIVTSGTAATGTRCFRIIVPACSATGTPARIATLGTPVNSNPLTHMSITSALLPQRKRSADKELSPEKRAAKRRRLEKKYPLPPGVVIKTEPLDSPQPTTTLQAGSMRSLLGQNIQLITNSRAGNGSLQNIRIIAPSGGSRQMRLAPNVVLRTPNVSVVTTGSISTVPTVSVSRSGLIFVSSPVVSSSSIVTSSASEVVNSSSGSSTSTSSSIVTTASQIASTIPVTTTVSDLTSSTTVTNSTAANDSSCILSSQKDKPSSLSSAVTSSDRITTLSYSTSAVSVLSSIPHTSSRTTTTSTSTPSTTSETSSVESLKDNIASLRKLIHKQEVMGLQGMRLQKLKDVLEDKEKSLAELLNKDQTEVNSSNRQMDNNEILTGSEDQNALGLSLSDPVVID